MISTYNHLLHVLLKIVKSLYHLCIYPVSNTCHCTATQRWDDKNLGLATRTTTPCGQGKHLAHPANHLEHHRTSFSNIFRCPKGRTCAPPFLLQLWVLHFIVSLLSQAFHSYNLASFIWKPVGKQIISSTLSCRRPAPLFPTKTRDCT